MEQLIRAIEKEGLSTRVHGNTIIIGKKLVLDGISTLQDIVKVHCHEKKWIYERWRYIPGPGPDDVVYETKNIQEIIDIVHNHYYGSSTKINGWIIPLYLHPEWSEDKIESLVKNINKVTLEFIENRNKQLKPNELLSLYFNSYQHESNSSKLWLRRDLEEAYYT